MLRHERHDVIGVLKVAGDDHRHVLGAVPPLIEGLHCGSWDVADDAFLPDGQPLRVLQITATMFNKGNVTDGRLRMPLWDKELAGGSPKGVAV